MKTIPSHNRSNFRHLALLTALMAFAGSAQAQLYWNTNGTAGVVNAANWSTSSNGPFTTAWVSGTNIVFTANSAVTNATTTVGNILVTNNATVTWAAGGTYTPGGVVRTFDIATGSTLNWTNSIGVSSAAGSGITKNGGGIWGISNSMGASSLPAGVTLNAGTIRSDASKNYCVGSGLFTINGGTWQSSSSGTNGFNGMAIGGDFTVAGTGNLAMSGTNIASGVSLGSATRTITNITTGTGNSRQFNGVISGSGGLTLSGTGTGLFYLANTSNSFTGAVSFVGGVEVIVNDNGAFGAGTNITIDGGRFTMGSMDFAGAASALTNATISSNRTIYVGATAGTAIGVQGSTGVTTFNGVIADKPGSTGAWAKQGGGKLVLGGASTYSGGTAVNNGTVQLDLGNDRLPTGTLLSLGQASTNNTGILDLNGRNQTVAGLVTLLGTSTSTNVITNTSSTNSTLTVNVAGNSTNIYGSATAGNMGILAGNIALTKSGSGTQVLGNSNSITGDTLISAGTLALTNGGFVASTNITVSSGANLDVSGATTAIALNATQVLRAGGSGSNSSARLTVVSTKGLTLGSSGGLAITGYNGGSTAPLVVDGASDGALALNSAPVSLNTTTALTAGTYKLIAKTNSATGVTGTPGTLSVSGSNTSTNGMTLAVTSGELILTVASAPGTPTITGITAGDKNLSVAFTAPVSDGGASITNYQYSLDGGSSWVTPSPAVTTSPLLITGLVNGTTYNVQLRAVNAAGFGTATASTPAAPVAPAVPSIAVSPATLSSALSTTYGSNSTPGTFSVSGENLTGNLTVTAPANFAISSDGSTYTTSSLTLTASGGTVASTTIYVRLLGTVSVSGSPYSGNVAISGGGATTANVAIPNSTVSAKALTITGISIDNKVYDQGTTATISGTAAYSGLENGDSFAISGSPSASFANKNVGTNKAVTVTGYTAPSSNYTVSQPSGLTANITAKEVTITSAAVTAKTYNGTTAATITGTLSGVLAGDTVNLNGTGTFASATAGTGIAVTSTSTLGGADAANYSLTQPTGLTGNINKANQTITFTNALTGLVSGTTNALTGTSTSSLPITYTVTDTNVATISGTNLIAIATGSTTVVASQAGDGNYNAATPVTNNVSVSRALQAGDIAILSYNADNPDEFSFVTLVSLEPGLVINFTDNGFASATTGNTGEGFLTFTVPADTTYAAGTVFKWTNGMTISGTPWNSNNPSNFSFNTSGDQLFAFQGPTANWGSQSGINLLAGLIQRTTWLASGTAGTATSYQPSGLTASYIVSLATENGYFANGTSTQTSVTVSGNRAALLALFDDGTGKWYNNATGPLTAPTYNISLGSSQTITFASLFPKTYGDASFDATVSSSSGLPVTLISQNTNVATVSGTTITIVGAGSANLVASQAGGTTNGVTYLAATPLTNSLTVAAASLPAITWSNGVISSAGGVSSFSYTYGGRNTNGVNTSYSNANAPTAPGFYTVVATSTDANYSGSTTNNYYVAGPVAVADAVTKPAGNPPMTLTLASLLANDVRITTEGGVATDGLSITAVTGGSGNSAQIDGGDVLFTSGSASPETFTYTLSYGGQTASGTVTVTTETSAPTFALQIVKVGTATYSAPNTTVKHDFIGVPNQTYLVEYTTDLNGAWTSVGTQSTGDTGSFSVTLSQAGDMASAWNSGMFFRAKVNP